VTPFPLRRHTILLALAGSRSQGIHTPSSDVDLRGVAVPPATVLLGWRRAWEQEDGPGSMDVFADLLSPDEAQAGARYGLEGTVYDLRKLVRLAADCNPNLLELVFCPDAGVRLCTPLGERLRAAGPAFLSQKARHTFGGYARGQLARIRTHRKWLLNPPKAPPRPADFDLPDGSPAGEKQRQYQAACRQWQRYRGWLSKRNPARAVLEATHGYDTKHAAHLVRLLRMGRELLETGQVHVWRGDRDGDELQAIRAGAWTYDQLDAWAEQADRELDQVITQGRCVVPDQPDLATLDALTVDLLRASLDAEPG